MTNDVTLERIDSVAVVQLDDGRANALTYSLLTAVREKISEAQESDAAAILIAGNEKLLSAGLDLAEVTQGPEKAEALINASGDLFLDLFRSRKPVVIACTGHALAAGAVFLLVADARFGRAGHYKIGLNEVAIGVPLPKFVIALTQIRFHPPQAEAAALGDVYSPADAQRIGYLDAVVAGSRQDVLDAALARAEELGARPSEAFATTKLAARQSVIDRFAASR